MTTYFEYNEGREPMGDVIPFEKPKWRRQIEHVDASTIVERTEWTDEIRAKFERAYGRALGNSETSGDDDSPRAA